MRWALPALGVFLTFAPSAGAFVATPVGGHPRELDVNLQVTAERGKTEPTENQDAWFKTQGFYEYKLGAGYTFGDLGPLEFFALRLEGTFFQSPVERSDPSKFFVAAPGEGARERSRSSGRQACRPAFPAPGTPAPAGGGARAR